MARKRKPIILTRRLGKTAPGKGGKTPYGMVDMEGNVYIDPRQSKSEMLDTLVHEMLHIAYPRMSEKSVRGGSLAISTALWRRGYRQKR
jgi:hypothetical protein